jgi:hypothetical protein
MVGFDAVSFEESRFGRGSSELFTPLQATREDETEAGGGGFR